MVVKELIPARVVKKLMLLAVPLLFKMLPMLRGMRMHQRPPEEPLNPHVKLFHVNSSLAINAEMAVQNVT